VDVHYPIADHRQPVWGGAAFPALPRTERACATVLTLPCFPEMTEEEVDAICAAVNEWTPASADARSAA
jgi:dTDP-4-amino-4,6-dideoxygalactose transaminase